jgi:hypothetical protein
MDDPVNPLETLWDGLLSREPARVRQTFEGLQSSERQVVLDHLARMASEPGWQPEQRASAQAALAAIQRIS